jgi:hypothetical protein
VYLGERPDEVSAVSWWERWQERQEELAQGADADLVRDNRRKWRLGWGLSSFALLLLFVLAKVPVCRPLQLILGVVALVSVIIGGLVSSWARAESRFLNRPDREKPPSIFKG